jgi:phage shock protein A
MARVDGRPAVSQLRRLEQRVERAEALEVAHERLDEPDGDTPWRRQFEERERRERLEREFEELKRRVESED